ncbi:hypothetical protein FTO70_12445 [Methanosarcina sp. KYL-1]|uniref:hypothetical protein n=1 Tax=Methanosarcina sp. KYL-1 TaxID=2602068 RepID=UPI002101CD0C|nr:hypothetical protein [Methanosarcina sp. KYL-1]MCQ1536464.1 hypothetical protein [Methanosarcina sp. KYL-1]
MKRVLSRAYLYDIALDVRLTFEQEIRADYADEPGSSEIFHINLIDNPESPIEMVIEYALGV